METKGSPEKLNWERGCVGWIISQLVPKLLKTRVKDFRAQQGRGNMLELINDNTRTRRRRSKNIGDRAAKRKEKDNISMAVWLKPQSPDC